MIHADCEGIGFSCDVAKESTNVTKLTSLQHIPYVINIWKRGQSAISLI